MGWVRGGLGMSVVLAEYFFSGISGSTIADVSAIGAMLTPPMLRAGYKPEHAASLVASATAMGILVPPAIFMIVLGQVTDTSVVGHLPRRLHSRGGDRRLPHGGHPRAGASARLAEGRAADLAELFEAAARASLVPLVVPIIIVPGSSSACSPPPKPAPWWRPTRWPPRSSTTERDAWREMVKLIYESALLTAAVVFLLAGGQRLPVPDGHAGRAAAAGRAAPAPDGHAVALPGRGGRAS